MNCSRILALLSVLSLATLAAPAASSDPVTRPSTRPATAPDEEFVVFGRVTDELGKPLAGVVVQAKCGDGTLHLTGSARSDRDGRYHLSFGPALHYERGLGRRVVGLQAATIMPSKKGFFEKNLHRQGDLGMTDDPNPRPEETRHFAGVVRVGRPYELNFVMVRAATVEGRLTDPDGQPIPAMAMTLTGPELPPSSGILASTKTDADGRFRFTAVPTGYEWSFATRDKAAGEDIAGAPFTIDDAATPARFNVVFDAVKHTVGSTRIQSPPAER